MAIQNRAASLMLPCLDELQTDKAQGLMLPVLVDKKQERGEAGSPDLQGQR